MAAPEATPGDRAGLLRVSLGFALLWAALDRTAAATNSLFGEAGPLVLAAALAAGLLVERALFGRGPRAALLALGLGRPTRRSLLAALLVSALMLAFYPLFSLATGAGPDLRGGWPWLTLGLFAQGGLAEEMVFRGYLFGRLREGRRFWRAALLAMAPFLAAHLPLFFSMELPVALAATLLAAVISFPLAQLYELGGRTVWAPALLHFVIQGSIKLAVFPEAVFQKAAIGWMALSALAPWLVFAFRRSGGVEDEGVADAH